MRRVVPAEGVILERILEMTDPVRREGLGPRASAVLEAAPAKTAWALRHQRRFALMDGTDLLASAQRFTLDGVPDHQPVRICGIGAVITAPAHRGGDHARWLVGRLADDAARRGAEQTWRSSLPSLTRSQIYPTGSSESRQGRWR